MNSGHGECDTSGSGLMSTPQLPEASAGHFLGVDSSYPPLSSVRTQGWRGQSRRVGTSSDFLLAECAKRDGQEQFSRLGRAT